MKNFNIGNIASGRVVPHSVEMKIADEAKKAEELKSQRRHDWKIAIFNTFGGAIAGLVTSIIFWLITK